MPQNSPIYSLGIETNEAIEFVGAKTALDSIQREKNELKVEVMNITTRLAATDAEKDELKAQNAELMIVNENAKRDAAKYKHENICKWKEEQAFKAKIVELENAAKQYVCSMFPHLHTMPKIN